MKQTYRILIADDEMHVLATFSKVLKQRIKNADKINELKELEKSLFDHEEDPLLKFDYDLTLCEQGNQAVDAVKKAIEEDDPFSIVFLDVRMPPGIDGIEAAEQIRAIDQDIEIVIVTAFADTNVDDVCRRIPPLDKLLFILKPFHPIEVVQFTAALVTKWENERNLRILHGQMEEELKFREDNIMILYEKLQNDIQRRKRYEKQLERHAIVFETMDEAVLISDTEGKLIDANESFEKIYGYTKQDFLGKRLDIMHPDGTSIVDTILRNLKNEGSWVGELPIVRKNGRKGWVRVNVKEYYDEHQKLIGYLSVNRDITENKRAFDIMKQQKNLMEDVFTRIHEGIGFVNEKEDFIFVNPSFARIFETSVESLIGNNLSEYLEDIDQSMIDEQTSQRKRNLISTYELNIKTKKGNKRTIQVSAYPRKDVNGAYLGAFGVIQDITEQKRLKEQFLQSQKMEAMGRLAGGIAHDFNNLLTIIRGSSELLRTRIPEDLEHDFLEEIVKASDQAKLLVDQLLLFSRKQTTQTEIIQVNNIIEETHSLLKRILGVNIAFEVHLDPEIGLVEVDSGQIKQIMMNLAVNSRDAMPTGGKITLTTRNIEIDEKLQGTIQGSRPGSFVSVSFKDTGKGIPEDVIPQIFEPFFTTKEAGHGTGLGLSTIFGIIQKHNGWINVESKVNQGTCFTFYIPRIDSDFVHQEQENQLIVELKGKGETVLVVQENHSVREFTSKALQENGYRTYTESNALGARNCFNKNKAEIDIVVSDVNLSDSTGMFIINEMISQKPTLKAVLTSGFVGEDEKLDLIESLQVPLLLKPYTIKEMLVALKQSQKSDIDLEDYCELYEICNFINPKNPEQHQIIDGWKRMFCKNLVKSERCKRKKYFFETGKQPEPNMTPTGNYLEE